MSTCNFETMDDFPLICGGMYSEYADAYKNIDEDDETPDEAIYDEINYDANIFESMARKFTDTLQYYDVSIASGYYDGWQFIVKPKYDFDDDAFHKESTWCIDNDDAHYYFDKCRSKVLREAAAERHKICKWLDLQSGNAFMHKLDCVGVFSNGEAIYKEVV